MKTIRYIVIALNVFVVLLLGAVGVVAWAVGTESGTAWIVERIVSRAQPTLEIESVAGTLFGQLELGGIRYRGPADDVTVDHLAVAIDLFAILRNRLVIEDLAVSDVRYRGGARPATGADTAAAGAEIDFDIVIENAVVSRIVIDRGEAPVTLERTTLAGSYAGGRVHVIRLETRYEGFALSGQGDVRVAGEIDADGVLSASGRYGGEMVLGSVSFRGGLETLEIEAQLLEPFAAEAEGTVSPAGRRVDLELTWRDLALPGVDVARSAAGSVSVGGTPAGLEFQGSAEVEVDGVDVEAEARGDWRPGMLTLDTAALRHGEATVNGAATLDLDTLSFAADIDARGLDPALAAEDLAGSVAATGKLTGRLGAEFEVATDALALEGEILEHPFSAELSGRLRDPTDVVIDGLDVTLGSNRLSVAGTIGDTIALELRAELPDVAAFLPEASGGAQAMLTLAGTREAPIVSGRVDVTGATYGDYAAASASLAGRVGAFAGGDLDLTVDATGVRLGRLDVANVAGTVSGPLRDHRAALDVQAARWSAALGARGAFEGFSWRGQLDDLSLDQAELGRWSLASAVGVTAARGQIDVEHACLDNGGAELCLGLRYRGDGSDLLDLSADDFAIETLQPFLPETLVLSGRYDLDARLEDFTRAPSGSFTLRGGATRVLFDMGAGDTAEMTIDRIGMDARLDAWRVDLTAGLEGRDTGQVELVLTTGDIRDPAAPVTGRLDAFWPDVAVMSVLSPDVGAVTGSLTASLGLAGTADAPQLDGRASWSGGSIEIPVWDVVIDGIEAEAVSPDGATIEFRGSGLVDGSALDLTGRTELSPERGWPTRLRLTGERLHLVQLADADVFVSPDLEVDVALPDVTVSGSVQVPQALIALDELPEQAVRPSPDSVIHGERAAEAAQRPLQVAAAITLTLGDDVRYTGSNLRSQLSGSLELDYGSGRPTNAMGTLNIAGTYEAYGQTLELDRGLLLFAGPLENPNLDVRAVRRINETTVGIQLSGSVQAPQTQIFSEPAMAEADALSYLLFGRPISSSEAGENATLRSAALAMGLQQALPVVERIGDSLGLDEFSIETTDVDAGALMAGKYLSPKLYVRYSYGLFNRVGGLLLRFRINDRFSLETRSGDQRSMDLLYTVEKE